MTTLGFLELHQSCDPLKVDLVHSTPPNVWMRYHSRFVLLVLTFPELENMQGWSPFNNKNILKLAGKWDDFCELTSILFLSQDKLQPAVSSTKVAPSDLDISGLCNRPNELGEELVRVVASLHQRAAESLTVVTLATTSSQALAPLMRKLTRRSSQVSPYFCFKVGKYFYM